jgi:hypothetical protein
MSCMCSLDPGDWVFVHTMLLGPNILPPVDLFMLCELKSTSDMICLLSLGFGCLYLHYTTVESASRSRKFWNGKLWHYIRCKLVN